MYTICIVTNFVKYTFFYIYSQTKPTGKVKSPPPSPTPLSLQSIQPTKLQNKQQRSALTSLHSFIHLVLFNSLPTLSLLSHGRQQEEWSNSPLTAQLYIRIFSSKPTTCTHLSLFLIFLICVLDQSYPSIFLFKQKGLPLKLISWFFTTCFDHIPFQEPNFTSFSWILLGKKGFFFFSL